MAISNDNSTSAQTDNYDDLETELKRIDGNVNGLYAPFSDLKDRVAELEAQNERQRMQLESLRTRTATPESVVATDGGVDK